MQIITEPIAQAKFVPEQGKTVVTTMSNKAVWVNGNQETASGYITFKLNEVGDTFIAAKDSTTLDENKKPLYLKGDKVTRQKESVEFMSFKAGGSATEFALAAKAMGLNLVVQLG